MSRRGKLTFKDEDMGGGFWICREKHGSSVEYIAMHLDAPGGYVIAGRSKRFPYRFEAEKQIADWKAELFRQTAKRFNATMQFEG